MKAKKMAYGSLHILIILSLSFAMAADETADNAAIEEAPAENISPLDSPAKDKPLVLDVTPSHRGFIFRKYQMFSTSFPDFQPGDLHWIAPSMININSDGTWFIYAKHLAHLRRTAKNTNSGKSVHFSTVVKYWDGKASKDKCTGKVIHAHRYYLRTLRYRDEALDASAKGTDPAILGLASKIRCASFYREIEQH